MAYGSLFVTTAYKIPTPKAKIVFVGDIHKGSPLCDLSLYRRFIKTMKESITDRYFIGTGDWFNKYSTVERKAICSSQMHDDTRAIHDMEVRAECRSMANDFSFMKGRLIGIVEGNHHYEFGDGTTSTEYMCELLRL